MMKKTFEIIHRNLNFEYICATQCYHGLVSCRSWMTEADLWTKCDSGSESELSTSNIL